MVPSIEGFGTDGILNRHVDGRLLTIGLAIVHIEHVAIERDIFIQTPLARTVVNHDVTHRIAAKRVLTVGYQRLTAAETHVTNNDVVRIYLERLPSNNHALARSRLPGYRDIRSTHIDGRLQADDTTDVEHHNTCTTLFTGPTERARAVIVQVGNGEHLATTSTKGKHTTTFGTRKCGYLGLAQVVRAKGPGHVGTPLFSFFNHYGECHLPSGVGMCLPLFFLFGDEFLSLISQVRILCAGTQTHQAGHCHQQYFLHFEMF